MPRLKFAISKYCKLNNEQNNHFHFPCQIKACCNQVLMYFLFTAPKKISKLPWNYTHITYLAASVWHSCWKHHWRIPWNKSLHPWGNNGLVSCIFKQKPSIQAITAWKTQKGQVTTCVWDGVNQWCSN